MTPPPITGDTKMRKMTECLNKICNREDWQSRWPGHLDQCPRCGTIDVSKIMIPSIAYDKNGHPIES
jgi:hypothetical protein